MTKWLDYIPPHVEVKKVQAAVTFDQPLFAKADDICLAKSREFDRFFLRLGGFHTLMSYMGGVGFNMRGSGAEDLLGIIYAPKTVEHMMNGKAYARALRGHLLVSAAVVKLMLEQKPGCLKGVSIQHLKTLHELLLRGSCDPDVMMNTHTVSQLTHIIDGITKEFATESRTGKLWVNYITQVQMIRLFIYAERTGDLDLHMYCITQMIPIFHASGHFAYAKSSRRYLDIMRKLPSIMLEDQYEQFSQAGYFTIRRCHRFWSGNFTDQTIEQDLMRQLKAPGGLAHGRGLTASTQAKFVHTMPKCTPICNDLEEFCNVHTSTTDQHTDLRASASSRDSADFTLIYDWLSDHSPFAFPTTDGLVNISNGVVAESSANAEQAYELGKTIAEDITGKTFGEVKLKRSHRVTSISAASNAIAVRGKEVEINSELLLLRVSCITRKPSQMKGYLQYEFARRPPSMFEHGLMRKTTKSVLADLLKSDVEPVKHLPPNAQYVKDGGHTIHEIKWPESGTYGDVCNEYIAHTENHYRGKVTCLFDGYNDENSTKREEQDRRITGTISPTIVFTATTELSKYSQKEFLNNRDNKAQFISLLSSKMEEAGIECLHSEGDADYLIASTVIAKAAESDDPVVLVGNDTDLVGELVSESASENVFMKFGYQQTYRISDMQAKLNENIRRHILLLHSISGCDSVSALFRKGKKAMFNLFLKPEDFSFLDIFQNSNATGDEIAEAGEKLLLKLYGADESTQSLDEHRYAMYNKQITKKSITSINGFELKALPPTSDAAKYHSYRAYLQVQQWKGNTDIRPTDWGWSTSETADTTVLVPTIKDKPDAPDRVLKMVSCGCKKGCEKRCRCRKAGLLCTSICSGCSGLSCNNSEYDVE